MQIYFGGNTICGTECVDLNMKGPLSKGLFKYIDKMVQWHVNIGVIIASNFQPFLFWSPCEW